MNRAVYSNELVEVTKSDVLCGRSPEEQCHPGNTRLKNCIELHRVKYADANKANKSKIIRQIVEIIGGRFLKKNKDGDYVVIPPRGAREKVGLAMREALEPNKGAGKTSSPKSSSAAIAGSSRKLMQTKPKPSSIAPLPRNVSAPSLDLLSVSAIDPIPVTVNFQFKQAVVPIPTHVHNVSMHQQSSSSSVLSSHEQSTSISEEVITRAAADLVCESDLSEFLSSLDDVFLMDTSVPLI